jgi:hypothetical protein
MRKIDPRSRIHADMQSIRLNILQIVDQSPEVKNPKEDQSKRKLER